MMRAAKRKVFPRLSPRIKRHTSPTSPQGQKMLLVDQAVWTIAERLSAQFAQVKLEAKLELKEWMSRTLFTLVDFGYAIRSTDDDGNLIIKSADKLLVETGHKAGRLRARGYYYPAREH